MIFGAWSSEMNAPTQFRDTRSTIKALYVYTFATLIDWPSEYKKGNFLIGIYGGNDGVYNELKTKYSGKAIGSQEIEIIKYDSKSDINKPNILYISSDRDGQLTSLSSEFKSKSTLMVAEKDGSLVKGADINFVLDGSKQTYEVSVRNTKKHNLVVASKLTSLAHKVIE